MSRERLIGIMLLTLPMTIGCQQQESVSDPLIVGGQAVGSEDPVARSTAYIATNGQLGCTATIVGPRQAVTAAHCFRGNGTQGMRLGFGSRVGQGQLQVTGFVVHPSWTGDGASNDIAVMAFTGNIPAGYGAAAIGSGVQRGQQVVVAGYGQTSENDRQSGGTLRSTTTSIASLGRGEFTLAQDRKGTCYGDSGGPTYINSGNGYAVVGATSRGNGGPCDNGDSINTDVTSFQGWLACSFEALQVPMQGLANDGSENACSSNRPNQAGGRGNSGGQPGGFPGGQPGGFPGGQPGGFPGGQPGGFPGGQPGGFRGGQPGGFPGGQPGGFPGGGGAGW